MDRNQSKAAEQYRTRKAAGLCVNCSAPAQPDRVRCESCLTDASKGQLRWKARHPDKVRDKRLQPYALTHVEYEALVAAQGGCCALCGKPPPGRGNNHVRAHARPLRDTAIAIRSHTKSNCAARLAVDHDHATGKIRALLCTKCNTGLGCFGDSEELLGRAIEYLRRHRLRSIG